MTIEALDVRRQRGLEIAATSNIVPKGEGAWLVPSQTLNGKYRVERRPDGFTCTCPDYELRGATCKHGYAVEFVLRRETKPNGTVIETRAARVTYSQNWTAYNMAQTTEKRHFCTLLRDLVSTAASPEQKRGRPMLPLPDMLFAAAFKVYSTVSARRFMTDLSSAEALGFIDKTPHYNSIFNVLERESLTPILYELIIRSAMPLRALETDFAVDSTGFGLQQFYRHFTAKYGHPENFRDYLKLHAVVGTRTNVIANCKVTDRNTGDSPMLPPLLDTTEQHFDVKEVSADKAYCSNANMMAIDRLGAKPFIPFRANNKPNPTQPLWNKLFHFFQFNRDEFLAQYHKRSNVVATFSALKRKFGDTLRSKTTTSQKNELLLMVLCHNIVCVIHEVQEHGIVAMFPALDAGCPISHETAQQLVPER